MNKKVIITISESEVDKTKKISRLLKRDGLIIENVFDYGIITGFIDNLDKLDKYSEILDFNEEIIYKINPPDSEIQ